MHLSVSSTFNSLPMFLSALPPSKSLKMHKNSGKVVLCRAGPTANKDGSSLDYHKMHSLHCMNNAASVDDIKKAYRKMALRYHPDVCEPSRRDECSRIFVELQATYKTLLDQASTKPSRWELVELNEKRSRQWESQIMELSRRSQLRKTQRGETWGSRIRAQHMHN